MERDLILTKRMVNNAVFEFLRKHDDVPVNVISVSSVEFDEDLNGYRVNFKYQKGEPS